MSQALDISGIELYSYLGVDRRATTEEIAKAYKAKALIVHPDKNRNDPNATLEFQKLHMVYDTLTDPIKRMKYDRGRPREIDPKREIVIVKQKVLKKVVRAQKKEEKAQKKAEKRLQSEKHKEERSKKKEEEAEKKAAKGMETEIREEKMNRGKEEKRVKHVTADPHVEEESYTSYYDEDEDLNDDCEARLYRKQKILEFENVLKRKHEKRFK